MNRRTFLHATFGAAVAAAALSARGANAAARPPRILLRNAWQSINIGDIAHPLGFLELLEQHLPQADVVLWPSNVENGAEELLKKRFPKLVIIDPGGEDAISNAFQYADVLVHGSGSGFVAQKDVALWRRETGKPYGIFGISYFSKDAESVDLLTNAKFCFFRESVSLAYARERGVKCPVMDFGPDSAFGVVTLRNDDAAKAYLAASGLEEGKFLCCIPRYRWTPFWLVKTGRAFDQVKHDRNQAMKEHDHAPHRAAIEAVVRETDLKVLVCCEDQTQIPLGKEMVYDPLPDDVKRRVVWRDKYWLTDEALSVYVRSAGLFGNEMHSPIMCVSSGIPAVVCRFPEQTNKGYMWRDIGLDDWLFNLDEEADVKRIPSTVLEIAKEPERARAKAKLAGLVVRKKQAEQMAALKAILPA